MFKNSSFQESLKDSNIAVLKMKKGTNVISVLISNDEGEKLSEKGKKNFKLSSTDAVKNINVYVRLMMNVSVFDWANIDKIREFSKEKALNFANAFCVYEEDHEYIRNTVEGKFGNVEIVTWITVDIPYIQSQLENVNGCIKEVLDNYFETCNKLNVNNSDERFALAKFVAKINTIWEDNSFNGFVVANYQRSNTRSTAIHARFNVPSDIQVKKGVKDIIGCNITTANNIENNKPVEVLFDDKLKISEFHVLRFIKKSEDLSFPQFACRNIVIYKNNKIDGTLIKNNRVSIEVGNINFSVKDNTKLICPIDEFMNDILVSGNKQPNFKFKFTNEFINAIKSIANKILKNYSAPEEKVAE